MRSGDGCVPDVPERGSGRGSPYSGAVLEVERWPDLRDPVLVVALSGWVDAGMAGAGAAAVLTGQLDGARPFAAVPLADHADLQQTRPTVELVDGATRGIVWPKVELTAGRADRDVVVLRGPEPSLHWTSMIDELVDVARRLDVTLLVTLGGMPVPVSHRRPARVLATATDPEMARRVGALRADYTGPTGAQTALQVALADVGVPGVGLWAQVPHYVSGSPSPPAIRALLARLAELARLRVDLAPLDPQCDEWVTRVDEGLVDRPEIARLVEQIEESDEELPSGDELASEIERFLRDEQ